MISATVDVTNPQLQGVAPAIRDAYGRFLVAMADSELVIGHRHSEWTGFAPNAEEDVAFSSIAQDEMGHAHLYYALVTGATDEDAIDRLALDRSARSMRHLPLLHAPNGDWYFTIARHIYWDAWEDVLLSAALQSTLPLLASASQRLLNEELYHEEHAVQWLELLSSRSSSRARLQAALTRVVELGGNPARRLDGLRELGEQGLLPAATDLDAGYAASLRRRLEHVGGWPTVDAQAALAGLNSDGPWPSPPGLQRLHSELTGMRRAHPGATW
ncbi:MAG TPA: 1,2-phenylacetyl-CoA epoxidase subunit PaaC [Candidatus Dormibacteraeota bacterium]|nr:1,2-phenylacetyl-CoA epoxidase subunit PaaC [Candidatus Dormibacteraeota bacterium]